jgi:uncharacterized membrane protein YhaH (DUF805 family)
MNLVEAIKSCFQKFVSFRGRAPRSEFWFFTLFQYLVLFFLGITDAAVFHTTDSKLSPLSSLATLVFILPNISVTVRRLHDTNRSGVFLLWFLLANPLCIAIAVALVGAGNSFNRIAAYSGGALFALLLGAFWIYYFYLMIIPGTLGANDYGEDVFHNPIFPNITERSVMKKETNTSSIDLLERLHRLFQNGVFTDEEYNIRKKHLLETSNESPNSINNTASSNLGVKSSSDNVPSATDSLKQETKSNTTLPAQAPVNTVSSPSEFEIKKVIQKEKNSEKITHPFDIKEKVDDKRKVCKKCGAKVMKSMMICPKCDGEIFE